MKLITLLILLIPSFLSAQIDLSGGGGAAFPVGEFGASDEGDADFAQMGLYYNGNAVMRLTDALGVNISVLGTSNSLDIQTLKRASGIDNAYTVDVKNNYKTLGGFVGFHFSINLNQLYLNGRINGGYLRIRDADYSIYGGGNPTFTATHKATGAFGFLAGLSLEFPLNDLVSVEITTDYLHSSSEVEYVISYGYKRDNDVYELTIQNILPGARFSYHF